MTDDEKDTAESQALGAFTRKVWALERLAKKQGGYIKLVPAKPTRLKAYAARLYRAASRMSFVDLENVTPRPGEVCAFAPSHWSRMPLWDVFDTLKRCRGRLALVVVVGASVRTEAEQVLVRDPVEVARLEV